MECSWSQRPDKKKYDWIRPRDWQATEWGLYFTVSDKKIITFELCKKGRLDIWWVYGAEAPAQVVYPGVPALLAPPALAISPSITESRFIHHCPAALFFFSFTQISGSRVNRIAKTLGPSMQKMWSKQWPALASRDGGFAWSGDVEHSV